MSAERIRSIINLLNEDQDIEILRNVPGGKELVQYLRQGGIITHLADFVETPYDVMQAIDTQTIVVGKHGCAFMIGKSSGKIGDPPDWTIKVFYDSGYGTSLFSVEGYPYGMEGKIGPILKMYINVEPEKSEPRKFPRRVARNKEFQDQYRFVSREFVTKMFHRLIPVMMPSIKQSLNTIKPAMSDAINKGDYNQLESLSRRASVLNSVIAEFSRSETELSAPLEAILNQVIIQVYSLTTGNQVRNYDDTYGLTSLKGSYDFVNWAYETYRDNKYLPQFVKIFKDYLSGKM